MDTPVLGHALTTGVTVAANRFFPLTKSGTGGGNTSAAADKSICPITGTLSSLYVVIDAAPGAGLTRTFEVYKNGANTGVKVDLTGAAAVSGSDLAHTVSVAPGDELSLRTSATGATTNTGTIRWAVIISAAANTSLLMGAPNGAVSATVANYFATSGQNALSGNTGFYVRQTMPAAGTLKNLYAALSVAPGATGSYTITLYKNGSATGLTCTISGVATTTGSDLTHTVSVAAGDEVLWEILPSTPVNPTASQPFVGVEFDPTTDGQAVLMVSNGTAGSNTAVRYQQPTGMLNAAPVATEAPAQLVLPGAITLKNLYVVTSAAPGAAKSYQVQASVGASAGNPSATVTGAATTTANDTTNTRVTAAGDLLAMVITPSGTPTSAIVRWSMVAQIVTLQTLSPSAIGSSEAMGADQLNLNAAPTAIGSSEALGTDTVNMALAAAGAIATAEAMGADQLNLIGYPVAIASAEALGADTVTPGAVSTSPSAIASSEALGTDQLNLTVFAGDTATAEALGLATVLPGAVSTSPSGIVTAETSGTALLTLYLLPAAIGSSEALGTDTVNMALAAAGAIATAEAFGTALLNLIVLAAAIASLEAFGTALLNEAIAAAGAIATAEAFGTLTVQPGAVELDPSAIASLELVGDAVVMNGGVLVDPVAIASLEAFGTALLTPGAVSTSPSGIVTAETFGTALLTPGAVSLLALAIASAEAFGTLTVLPGAVSTSPSGIASAEQLGTLTVLPGAVELGPTGLASLEAFGTGRLTLYLLPAGAVTAEQLGMADIIGNSTLSPLAIATAAALGLPTVTPGPVTVLPLGAASLEAFGLLRIAHVLPIVGAGGIASAEAFGVALVVFGPQLTTTGRLGLLLLSDGRTGLLLLEDGRRGLRITEDATRSLTLVSD